MQDMNHIRPNRRGGRGGNASERGNFAGTNRGENSLQRTISGGTNCSGNGSQRSNDQCTEAVNGASQQRGRKKKSRTELKMPPRAGKIVLEPVPDKQFKYSNYHPKKEYTYQAQLGVILKHEYPGLVKDKDEHGNIIATRPASSWDDYFLSPDDAGITPADRVKREFWHLFEVRENDKLKANLVLENYAVDRVKHMMYSARVDAVKEYYRKQGDDIDDTLACPIELQYEQYMEGMVWWCKEEAWRHLCRNWCSDQFLAKRKRGQEARLKSADVAQNRGGSRPFTDTQQYLEHKFGPEKATALKTYAIMKSGMKNVDSSGSSGPINSQKAQKRIDDYSAAASVEYPNDWEQRPLDATILYNINGGLPHGRVPIGGGAVSKADVLSAARSRNIRPSSSTSYRNVVRQNQELRQTQEVHRQMILRLFEKLGEHPPLEMLRGEAPTQEQPVTSSSHAASLPDDNVDANEWDNCNIDSRGSNDHTGTNNQSGQGS